MSVRYPKDHSAVRGIPVAQFESENDLKSVLQKLDMGSYMTKFTTRKGKPESRMFRVCTDTVCFCVYM